MKVDQHPDYVAPPQALEIGIIDPGLIAPIYKAVQQCWQKGYAGNE